MALRLKFTGREGRFREGFASAALPVEDAAMGAKIVIEQVDNLPTGKKKVANTIKRSEPKYNTQGKK